MKAGVDMKELDGDSSDLEFTSRMLQFFSKFLELEI